MSLWLVFFVISAVPILILLGELERRRPGFVVRLVRFVVGAGVTAAAAVYLVGSVIAASKFTPFTPARGFLAAVFLGGLPLTGVIGLLVGGTPWSPIVGVLVLPLVLALGSGHDWWVLVSPTVGVVLPVAVGAFGGKAGIVAVLARRNRSM